MADPVYHHRQRGTVVLGLVVPFAGYLFISAVVFAPSGLSWGLAGGGVGFALLGWLFSSLTVSIEGDSLRHYFGPGFWKKSYPLADIRTARSVRTNILEGWGIHMSRYGWFYSVSGFGAVAMEMANSRRVCIGTDEPEALVESILHHAAHIEIEPPEPQESSITPASPKSTAHECRGLDPPDFLPPS